jgi:hypothetical protein
VELAGAAEAGLAAAIVVTANRAMIIVKVNILGNIVLILSALRPINFAK